MSVKSTVSISITARPIVITSYSIHYTKLYEVDLSGSYTLAKDLADVTLAVQNLFNQKYIGVVKNSLDDTRTGSTTYYQGAPISAVLSLNLRY